MGSASRWKIAAWQPAAKGKSGIWEAGDFVSRKCVDMQATRGHRMGMDLQGNNGLFTEITIIPQ